MYVIHVRSGLNNKLVPLMSLLKIANKNNTKILCYWEKNGVINNIERDENHFNYLFENIENIKFINLNELKKISRRCHIMNPNSSDHDRNSIIFPENISKDIFFNQVVHSIHLKNENIVGRYVPYPREKISKDKYIDDLREAYNQLKPKKEIRERIDSFIDNNFLDKKVLGLHIRTTDTKNRKGCQIVKDNLCGHRTGGFTSIDYSKSFDFIQNFLNDNTEWYVYISCDFIEIEKYILEKFGNKILYFDKPFGEKYEDKFDIYNGLKNSISEMCILSKCNKFLGTPGSSFSFSVWLLRQDELLDFWCENPW